MVEVGDCVWITDWKQRHHLGLVTHVMEGPNGPPDLAWIHGGYVTPDTEQRDEYGRPITRFTSIAHLGTDYGRKVWWTEVIMEDLVEA